MKNASRFALVLLAVLLLAACAAPKPAGSDQGAAVKEVTDITLWVFPVGNWGNPTTVSSMISAFQKANPHIRLSVEYLTYADGDARIEQAIADGRVPDLVLEGPERLVANWGDRGLMADLSDLWQSEAAGAVYGVVRDACRHSSGAYYEFPICMTAHCMAINRDLFQAADALQYLDEQTRTWTTEGFIHAVQALREHGQERIAAIYCLDQRGDQGTRALVNNLYGGSFTDSDHTAFTIDSEENIRALQLLYDLEGITFEPSMDPSGETDLFCRGELAMAFCWNVSLEIQQTINNPDLNFDILPMAFPADSGVPELQGGIWGFGVFDNGDEARLQASKEFIRYTTQNDAPYIRAVRTSTYWPVRDVSGVYENDILMEEYSVFMPYMGDYYQITPGWTEARTAWWKLLQDIGAGADVAQAVSGFPVSAGTGTP